MTLTLTWRNQPTAADAVRTGGRTGGRTAGPDGGRTAGPVENCESLVRQAALHKNVLLPAKERIEEALNFGGTQEITAGSRARMQEVDAVVAKLEDKLGNNWAEFTSSRNSFGVEANSIVRNLDSWRGTEQE